MLYRMPENVVKFADGNISAYEHFVDYWNHYRSTQGGKNLSFTTETSLDEKDTMMNGLLVKEVLRFANMPEFEGMPVERWASNPNVQWATFAVVSAMIDAVLPQTMIDSIGLYTDVRVGGWGDSFAFDIESRDLFAVSKMGRAKRMGEIQKNLKGQVTIVPELRSLTVGVALYRVLSGKESLAAFVAKALRSLEHELTVDVYTVFNTAMAALPNSPANQALRVSGYSQASLLDIAQKVSGWNAGQRAIVVGTPAALANVLPDDANYRYELDSDFVKLGYIRTINGYDVMPMQQIPNWKTEFSMALDDTKLYIISPSSQKLVKLCMEGTTMANVTGVYANANLTQEATLWKSWKAGIATNSVAGVIELS